MKLIASITALFLTMSLNAQTIIEPSRSTLWNSYKQTIVHSGFVIGVAKHGLNVMSIDSASGYLIDRAKLLLSGRPNELRIFEPYALVKTDDNRLHFIDITNLPELSQAGTVDPQREFADFVLYQDKLYLSLWFDGIARYQLNNFEDAALLDISNASDLSTDLQLLNNKLFVLDRYNGILRFDPSSGGFGSLEAYLPLDRVAASFIPADTLLYITFVDGGLLMTDFISGGSSITDSIPDLLLPEYLYDSETALVITEGHNISSLSRINFSELSTATIPYEMGRGDTISFYNEQNVLLPGKSNGILRFPIMDLTRSIQVLPRPGPISGIKCAGNRLVVANRDAPIDIYQMSDSGTLTFSHQLYYDLPTVKMIDYRDDSLLAVLPTSIDLFIQVTNPYSYHAVYSLPYNTDEIVSLKFLPGAGSRFAVLTYDQLELYTIRSNNSFELITSWPTSEPVKDFFADGDFIVRTFENHKVIISRVDDEYLESANGQITLPGITDNAIIDGNMLYLFSGTTAAQWDITDPSELSLDTTFETGMFVFASLIDEYRRLFISGPDGTLIYSLTDSLPDLQAFSEFGGLELTYRDDLLVTSDGTSVNIYDVSEIEKILPKKTLPDNFILFQNYPNPFNASTKIEYDLPKAGRVILTVFNILGREVARLTDSYLPAGKHTAVWDGLNSSGEEAASGVYYYRIKATDFENSKKMILLK